MSAVDAHPGMGSPGESFAFRAGQQDNLVAVIAQESVANVALTVLRSTGEHFLNKGRFHPLHEVAQFSLGKMRFGIQSLKV